MEAGGPQSPPATFVEDRDLVNRRALQFGDRSMTGPRRDFDPHAAGTSLHAPRLDRISNALPRRHTADDRPGHVLAGHRPAAGSGGGIGFLREEGLDREVFNRARRALIG